MELKIEIKRFDELKAYPEISRQEFTDAMYVGVNKVLADAQVNSPVDRGFFRSSLATDVVEPSPLNIVGQVFASAPHAAVIEGVDEDGNPTKYGRRPGKAFPNIGELRGWVQRVIGIEKVTAYWVEKNPDREIPSADALLDEATINIGRKIKFQGILAKRPIGRAMDSNKDFLQKLFDDATNRIARQIEGRGA